MAVRAFSEAVADPGHPFGKNPEDFTLVQLGSYEDSTGLFETHSPKSVMTGMEAYSQLVERKTRQNLEVISAEDNQEELAK